MNTLSDIERGFVTSVIAEEYWALTQYRVGEEPYFGFRYMGLIENREVAPHLHKSKDFYDVAVIPAGDLAPLRKTVMGALDAKKWLYLVIEHIEASPGNVKMNVHIADLGKHRTLESAKLDAFSRELPRPTSANCCYDIEVFIAPTQEQHQRWFGDFNKNVLN